MSTTAGSSTDLATTSSSSGDSDLLTAHGKTSIADGVVAKIAGMATKQVSGVHQLGGGTARAMSALRERVGASVNHAQGVTVEVGETQAAVDLNIIVEYGVPIADLAEDVRSNVISSIEQMTGLEVTEVNIAVDDIHLPSEDEDEQDDQPARVQ